MTCLIKSDLSPLMEWETTTTTTTTRGTTHGYHNFACFPFTHHLLAGMDGWMDGWIDRPPFVPKPDGI